MQTISLEFIPLSDIKMAPPKEPQIVVSGLWGWAATRLGIQPWGQILIIVLCSQALVLFPWMWSMHGDISKIQGSIQTMPLTISKDLLSQAKEDVSLKKFDRARSATGSAEILLAGATRKHLPAKQEDFDELLADLNILSASARPELSQIVDDTRVVLANYRSALMPQPRMRGTEAPVEKSIIVTVEAGTIDQSTLPGSVLVADPGANFEFLGTPFIRRLANAPSVNGIGFMFGAQHLDGWRWNDVAFVNTLIRYDGGEVLLNNVRFIQCTFELAANNPRSAKVATYIALEQPYLKIGPND